VPVFLPRLVPQGVRSGETAAHFTLERWRRNREYEAVLGVILGFAFLTAKLLLR
jgi:hypothetical protein